MSSATIETERLYTVEEFLNLEWPDDDDNDYELINGKIVAKPEGSFGARHSDIVGRVGTRLSIFAGFDAGEKRLGLAFMGASTVLGNPQGKNIPKPAVCFVLDSRLPKLTEDEELDGPIPVAPDLVVEVHSPSDTEERRHEKLKAYQQAGVSVIWSIHMLDKFALVYYKDQPYPKLRTLDDALDAGDIIPGFTLPVKDLFTR